VTKLHHVSLSARNADHAAVRIGIATSNLTFATGRFQSVRRRFAQSLLASCVGVFTFSVSHLGLAASGSETRLVMSSTIQAEPGADIPLSIEVTPVASAPDKSFIRIRGLPAAASLSEGHVIAPGAWAVALGAVPSLRLKLPSRQSGRSDLVVTLVGGSGITVAETRSSLIVAGLPESASLVPQLPPSTASPLASSPLTSSPLASTLTTAVDGIVPKALAMAPPTSTLALAASVPPQPYPIPTPIPVSRPPVAQDTPQLPSAAKTVLTPPVLSPDETSRAQRHVQRGQQELLDGNVAAARLLFRRAADMGYASGTLALAATYDPAELAQLGAFTIQPDPAEARRWYEKAQALGSPEADSRLKRLPAK
jgi:hypothetical protein